MKNKTKIILISCIAFIVIAAIITTILLIYFNTPKGKLLGNWVQDTMPYRISFTNNGKCKISTDNAFFSTNENGENVFGSNTNDYEGTFTIDNDKNLEISTDGAINATFSWKDGDSQFNDTEWQIDKNGRLHLGKSVYHKE